MVIGSEQKKKTSTIGIIGGGSWATALVNVLSYNKYKLKWWMRDKDSIKYLQEYHRNPKYLSGVQLNIKRGMVTNNLKRVIRLSDVIIVAVPSAYVKEIFSEIKSKQLNKKIIVSAIKGMIPDENIIIAEYFKKYFEIPFERIVVLSGPCHAEEVAQEKLSYLTMACPNTKNAREIAFMFDCRFIKTAVTDDIYGTEYTAVIKNIIAIASGICRGLGYGDNFQAVLISNAIQEIKKFVDAVHPIKRDIMGSAYLGDLLVTAYSQYSRNRTFGNMIGKGYSVNSAQMEMSMIAEGYYAVDCIHKVNKNFNIDMPITEAVYNILYKKSDPVREISFLKDKLS